MIYFKTILTRIIKQDIKDDQTVTAPSICSVR
jgi:hypothetical protein